MRCECCWADSEPSREDSYYEAMEHHTTMGCPCTRPGEAGDKARAGEFWDDVTKRDTRRPLSPPPRDGEEVLP